MSTDIELVTTALVEFDKVGAGLATLQKNYTGMLYDVETPAGMEMAKAARLVIRTPRYEIEKIRKNAKAPLLAIGKRLDSEAARITGELMKLEEPIDQQIKNEEGRKEREKQEKIDAEAKRVGDIQSRIAWIRQMAVVPAGYTAAQILDRRDEVQSLVIGADYQELTPEATAAKDQTAAILFGLHSSAFGAETEQKRIAAERAELATLRAENELLAKIERDRVAEEGRAAREQQEADAKTERDRIAQERAQLEKDKAALVKPTVPADPKRPSDSDIVAVLALHYEVSVATATNWLRSFGMSAAA